MKIARLYLLSDVLHNSSAPVKKASSYRTHLQKGLPEVRDSNSTEYREIGDILWACRRYYCCFVVMMGVDGECCVSIDVVIGVVWLFARSKS